jgi:prepilin peptidase CpaA
MNLLRTLTTPAPLPQDRLVSTTSALLAGAGLFATGAFSTGPSVALVGFLVAAVEEDVRDRRIPNRLTAPALAAALACAAWTAGLEGMLSALAGAALVLAVLVVPFALRLVGAGDVKAIAAVAAFHGAAATPALLWWITVAGGACALLALALRGGLAELLRRWWLSLQLTALERRLHYVPPAAGSTAAWGLPFAVAIALGVAANALWRTPWIA